MWFLLALAACGPYTRYEYLYQIGGVGPVEGNGRVDGVVAVPRGLLMIEETSEGRPMEVQGLAASRPVVLTRTGGAEPAFARIQHLAADSVWAVAAGEGSLAVLPADPDPPTIAWEGFLTDEPLYDIAVADRVLFVAAGATLHRLDLDALIASPGTPQDWYTTAALPVDGIALSVSQAVVWVLAERFAGPQPVSAFDATSLAPLGQLEWDPPTRGAIDGVLAHEGTLYATTGTYLYTADISDPTSPRWTDVELHRAGGFPEAVVDGVLWSRRRAPRLDEVVLVNVDGPSRRGVFEGICTELVDLEVLGRTFYAACGRGGLRVFAEARDWDDDLPW